MSRNWDQVASAITTRLAELEMTQQELANRSKVSTATLRELSHNRNPRRRSDRLLRAISVALQWPSDHLAQVADGELSASSPDRLTALETEVARLSERVRMLESKTD
ncbi:XRE family transcriptional regulator [Amycolatopsis sp. CA-230715]|uniref:XRE family transcriptional regulator n=1 Tax=Amycolatopsis sp. CA-230715 TaxID=2745196 RepID=UPI001C02B074|nr:XRE family transcriptional regulator [Amycolatopsis sp. CA-230715]QWF79767.1 hypothetical protein HUW46_03179 [Amycolatopsis sp. CA-230715]